MSEVQWLSPPPKKCETCDTKITDTFYDAKTSYGPWACMCPSCFMLGPGLAKLGKGLGQEYKKEVKSGKIIWKKTRG